MFICNQYIMYLGTLIALSIMYFCIENVLYFQYIMSVILLIMFVLIISESISQNKRKKVLDKLLPELAKNYYKNKYDKELIIHSVSLNWAGTILTKMYCNSGYVYLNEDKTDHIFISLSRQYRVLNISDSLEDDAIDDKAKELLDSILEKHNVIYSFDLNKSNCSNNQSSYNENLDKYLLDNNISLNILVVKDINDIEESEITSTCESISKEISSEIKNTLSENVFVKFAFITNDDIYTDIKESIDKFNYFDMLTLRYYGKFNLDNSVINNYEYLLISK